jgi:hypothetical protein
MVVMVMVGMMVVMVAVVMLVVMVLMMLVVSTVFGGSNELGARRQVEVFTGWVATHHLVCLDQGL